MKIYTLGYEGADIEDFTRFLQKSKIRRVADLRKNPVSRKRGFSKNRLAENLQLKKIEYLHLPGLGVPREWRKLAKEEKITRKKMFRDYVKKILPAQQDDVQLLIKVLQEKNTVLLCYEADPTDCHRSLVVEEIKKKMTKKVEIVNLAMPVKKKGRLFGISGSAR